MGKSNLATSAQSKAQRYSNLSFVGGSWGAFALGDQIPGAPRMLSFQYGSPGPPQGFYKRPQSFSVVSLWFTQTNIISYKGLPWRQTSEKHHLSALPLDIIFYTFTPLWKNML